MISGKMRGAAGITIPSGDAYYSVAGSTNTFTVPANVTSLCIAMTTGTTTISVVGKASVVRNSNNTWLAITSKYNSPTYTSSTSGLVLPIAAGVVGVAGKGGDASTSATTFQMNLLYNTHTYTFNGIPYNVPPNPVWLGGSSTPPAYISVSDPNGRYVSIPGNGYGDYNGTAYRVTDTEANRTAAMSFRYNITSSGGSTIPGTTTSIIISESGGSSNFWGSSSGTASAGSIALVPANTQTSTEKTISITVGSVSGWLSYMYYPGRSNTLGPSDISVQNGANISGAIVYITSDINNMTSHVNGLTVIPGETFTVKIGATGTGQAVRFMWGAGRSFPSNSA